MELKMKLLKSMYEYLALDEIAYSNWIAIFPDEPTEDDLLEITVDSEFWIQACDLFGRIVKRYDMDC